MVCRGGLWRRWGLSLAEGRPSLDDPRHALPTALRAQAARLRAQIAHEQRLLSRLDSLAGKLEQSTNGAGNDVLETLEMLTMFEKYMTEEQLATLAERKEQLGAAHIAAREAAGPRRI